MAGLLTMATFEQWLRTSTTLSDKSVRSYVGVIRTIGAQLRETDAIDSTLEEVETVAELGKIKVAFFAIPKNREADQRGRNMYSAGFNKYIAYRKDGTTQPSNSR